MNTNSDKSRQEAISECVDAINRLITEYQQIMNFTTPCGLLMIPGLSDIVDKLPFEDGMEALTKAQLKYGREHGVPIRGGF